MSEERKTPKLSVLIPAFNEEARIGKTLDQLNDYFAAVDYPVEVVVIDDGSIDRTANIVREYNARSFPLRLVQNDQNMGKGYTVAHGMREAVGDFRLFFDADGSTPIDQVEKFWPHFEDGADVCIGSRALPESDVQVHQPWYRETMGKIFNLFVRLLALRGFNDTQCGFKAFTAAAAMKIFPRQTLNGFGFDVELLYIANKHGLKTVEVPVVWINSPASRVHPVRDASRMFFELLIIRWRALGGRYR